MRTREQQIDSLYYGHNRYSTITQDAFRDHLEEAERRAEQRVRAEIGRDSERLDWLATQFKTTTVYMSGDALYAPSRLLYGLKGRGLREAIDAAREVG